MTGLDRYHNPEYRRLWKAARGSLERSGGVLTGSVSIVSPSEDERAAVIGLTRSHRSANSARVTVRMTELDEAVRRTTRLSLAEALTILGGPLRNKPAERDTDLAAREAVLAKMRSSPLHDQHEWFSQWAAELESGGALAKAIRQNGTHRILDAVRVLEHIEERAGTATIVLLPELADKITSDTKALNRGTPTATLVLKALARRAQLPLPTDAEGIRELWESADVVVDDLASRVLVLNLPAAGPGLGEWLTGAAAYGTPFQVTLNQLSRHLVRTDVVEVFVCENPAVLRRASEALGPKSRPLICTEGRPSAAFHRLAQIIRDGGGRLRYHGDFDWPGVSIARQVIERHQAAAWHFGASDYRMAVDGGERLPLKGAAQPTPWDDRLSLAMQSLGCAVYEESVSDVLLRDL
ncbi:conserved hypothetical protein [Catenulispora acidiphila DSM 44928]|uniref:TIGR02679 family protein n=1 Tax=Catenulispora acidiphila (strain DSM 44928 / JCM 14897 / NBRC 102108 / NRRL B-24433 / ID139908) TaxID=479433 RepID=C7QAN5_CATAD|nr:TIGR02679 family protein [Catenulispora acidiphila]ACU74358.1 conserved hypothetical protein [Catenulispora acidiphila DSM 44928]